jgi:hypothetical protein
MLKKLVLLFSMIGFISAVGLLNLAQAASYGGNQFISAPDSSGQLGLFFSETAQTPRINHGNFALDADWQNFQTGGNGVTVTDNAIPIFATADLGVAQDVEVNLALNYEFNFFSDNFNVPINSINGLDDLLGGVKVRIPSENRLLNFAVLGKLFYGPLSSSLGNGAVGFDIDGVTTYILKNNILLNGEFGITYQGGANGSASSTFVQLKLGTGIPLQRSLNGIAEFSINEYGTNGSIFDIGLRGGNNQLVYEGVIGLGLASNAPGIIVGGSVIFPL